MPTLVPVPPASATLDVPEPAVRLLVLAGLDRLLGSSALSAAPER